MALAPQGCNCDGQSRTSGRRSKLCESRSTAESVPTHGRREIQSVFMCRRVVCLAVSLCSAATVTFTTELNAFIFTPHNKPPEDRH